MRATHVLHHALVRCWCCRIYTVMFKRALVFTDAYGYRYDTAESGRRGYGQPAIYDTARGGGGGDDATYGYRPCDIEEGIYGLASGEELPEPVVHPVVYEVANRGNSDDDNVYGLGDEPLYGLANNGDDDYGLASGGTRGGDIIYANGSSKSRQRAQSGDGDIYDNVSDATSHDKTRHSSTGSQCPVTQWYDSATSDPKATYAVPRAGAKAAQDTTAVNPLAVYEVARTGSYSEAVVAPTAYDEASVSAESATYGNDAAPAKYDIAAAKDSYLPIGDEEGEEEEEEVTTGFDGANGRAKEVGYLPVGHDDDRDDAEPDEAEGDDQVDERAAEDDGDETGGEGYLRI